MTSVRTFEHCWRDHEHYFGGRSAKLLSERWPTSGPPYRVSYANMLTEYTRVSGEANWSAHVGFDDPPHERKWLLALHSGLFKEMWRMHHFDRFRARHLARSTGRARLYCCSIAIDPEDLVACTFEKAFNNFHCLLDLGNEAKEYYWLQAILRNSFLDAKRALDSVDKCSGERVQSSDEPDVGDKIQDVSATAVPGSDAHLSLLCFDGLLAKLQRNPNEYTGSYTAKGGIVATRKLRAFDVEAYLLRKDGHTMQEIAKMKGVSTTTIFYSLQVASNVVQTEFNKECRDANK